MVGRRAHRLLVGGVLATLGAMTTALGPTAAYADGPDLITIAGENLPEPVKVHADQQPRVFAAVHAEVDWLADRPSQGGEPEDTETLGPEYQVVVHVDGEPRYEYHLYPLAAGGPRAHRPKEQPGDRETRAGWFYGRLSMPETLVAAGVPVHGEELDTGGVGGGAAATPATPSPTRSALASLVEEFWTGMRVAGLVTAVVVLGVAVAAFAIRRAV